MTISIHALLAESDREPATRRHDQYNDFYPRSPCGERHAQDFPTLHHIFISIHALLAESDQYWATRARAAQQFLSTLSLRRATRRAHVAAEARCQFLSTLSLRRATKPNKLAERKLVFLSTLSLRRATQRHLPGNTHRQISIHALLAESDTQGVFNLFANPDFYPRSPCGERHQHVSSYFWRRYFYPRSPCGERR